MTEQIQETQEYSKFYFSKENRNVQVTKPAVKYLRRSMEKYGWLSSFPMMVRKNGKDSYAIVDGQTRFTVARELGIPVKYVIDNTDIDVSQVNQAQRPWSVEDYLNRWQKAGIRDYYEVSRFKNEFPKIPIAMCVGLLAGTNTWGNVKNQFQSGTYRVKTKGLAYKMGHTYEAITQTSDAAHSDKFLKALYACFYVDEFDPQRLVESCQKRPHLLQSYSKIDLCLEMIEEIYNYTYKTGRIPLKFLAQEAMKKRSAANIK